MGARRRAGACACGLIVVYCRKMSTKKSLEALREVLRVDRSPMNGRIWVAELACGHDLYVRPPERKPRLGAFRRCEKCAKGW